MSPENAFVLVLRKWHGHSEECNEKQMRGNHGRIESIFFIVVPNGTKVQCSCTLALVFCLLVADDSPEEQADVGTLVM